MDKKIENIKARARADRASHAELINRLSWYLKNELLCDMVWAQNMAAKYA